MLREFRWLMQGALWWVRTQLIWLSRWHPWSLPCMSFSRWLGAEPGHTLRALWLPTNTAFFFFNAHPTHFILHIVLEGFVLFSVSSHVNMAMTGGGEAGTGHHRLAQGASGDGWGAELTFLCISTNCPCWRPEKKSEGAPEPPLCDCAEKDHVILGFSSSSDCFLPLCLWSFLHIDHFLLEDVSHVPANCSQFYAWCWDGPAVVWGDQDWHRRPTQATSGKSSHAFSVFAEWVDLMCDVVSRFQGFRSKNCYQSELCSCFSFAWAICKLKVSYTNVK